MSTTLHRMGVQDGKRFTEILKGVPSGQGFVDRFPVAAYDFVAEVRLHYTGGLCFIGFRALGDELRSILLLNVDPDGSWVLKRSYAEVSGNSWKGKTEEVLAQQRPGAPLFKENQWTDLRIEARREVIEIQANGQFLLRAVDTVKPDAVRKPTSPGLHVGLASMGAAPARLEVDHVRVWRLGAQAPPAAPGAAAQELVLEETYDDRPSPPFRDARGQSEVKDGKHCVEVFPGNKGLGRFVIYGNGADDFVAEARLNFTGGGCAVTFRLVEDTDRRSQLALLVEPNGDWHLLRESGQPRGESAWVDRRETLHSARGQVAPLMREGQWTDLRVEARGDKITLRANGQLLGEFVDRFRPAPAMKPARPSLRIGVFATADAAARLEIDHVRLWRISAAGSPPGPPAAKPPETKPGEVRRFDGHMDGVWCLAQARDGRRALSTSGDKAVRLWNLPPPSAGPVPK